jgi:UDPglucose 6-dehydrogenase
MPASPPATIDKPVFVGLSHIGQVFSIGWAMKFGTSATFDFHADRLTRFRQGIVTDEEPDLAARFGQCHDTIDIYGEPERIADHALVFLTMDTPLDLDGEPNVDEVVRFISQCKPYLRERATLVILSQVYPGFCAQIKAELFEDRPDIRLVYMVDTLKMGSALPRFLEPEHLVFGVSRREDVPRPFESFRCQQYVLSHWEAEMVKVSMNAYLLFSVTFANAMDNYCRGHGMKFAPIADPLRHDARIGAHAYIAPSLGISGGHLERDLSTMIRGCQDDETRRLFEQVKQLNARRMEVLYDAVEQGRQERRLESLLWIGASYKRESFSLVNAPFLKFMKRFQRQLTLKAYDSYYPLPGIEGVQVVSDLEPELACVDCLIFHYASPEDTERVRRAAGSSARPLVFDISLPPSLQAGSPPPHLNVRRIF